MIEATRTYLQLTRAGDLREAPLPGAFRDRTRIDRVVEPPASFFRYLYAEVGRQYHWIDRLAWTDEQIRTYLSDPAVSLFVLSVDGAPAGYYELRRRGEGSTEIAYFGLLPEFVGRGLGGYLLTDAARQAWQAGASRVWLHTCSLDHPAALSNYLKRGFTPFREERYSVDT